MFEETLRIDYSNHILGLRLNFFVAAILCIAGLAWFVAIQRGWRVPRRRVRRGAELLGLAWIVAWAAGCGSSGSAQRRTYVPTTVVTPSAQVRTSSAVNPAVRPEGSPSAVKVIT